MLVVKRLDPRAILPTCAYPGEDLGYDLYALEDTMVSHSVTKVRTGIAAQHFHYVRGITSQYSPLAKDGLLIRDRSSMASSGVTVSGGVIDHGYTGEIIVLMTAHILNYDIKAGDKIAQMIPIPVLTHDVIQVDDLLGERGDKGFGSTGDNFYATPSTNH
jgi:dUTP pyrophosphatase